MKAFKTVLWGSFCFVGLQLQAAEETLKQESNPAQKALQSANELRVKTINDFKTHIESTSPKRSDQSTICKVGEAGFTTFEGYLIYALNNNRQFNRLRKDLERLKAEQQAAEELLSKNSKEFTKESIYSMTEEELEEFKAQNRAALEELKAEKVQLEQAQSEQFVERRRQAYQELQAERNRALSIEDETRKTNMLAALDQEIEAVQNDLRSNSKNSVTVKALLEAEDAELAKQISDNKKNIERLESKLAKLNEYAPLNPDAKDIRLSRIRQDLQLDELETQIQERTKEIEAKAAQITEKNAKRASFRKTKFVFKLAANGFLVADLTEKALVYSLTDRSPGYCAVYKEIPMLKEGVETVQKKAGALGDQAVHAVQEGTKKAKDAVVDYYEEFKQEMNKEPASKKN